MKIYKLAQRRPGEIIIDYDNYATNSRLGTLPTDYDIDEYVTPKWWNYYAEPNILVVVNAVNPRDTKLQVTIGYKSDANKRSLFITPVLYHYIVDCVLQSVGENQYRLAVIAEDSFNQQYAWEATFSVSDTGIEVTGCSVVQKSLISTDSGKLILAKRAEEQMSKYTKNIHVGDYVCVVNKAGVVYGRIMSMHKDKLTVCDSHINIPKTIDALDIEKAVEKCSYMVDDLIRKRAAIMPSCKVGYTMTTYIGRMLVSGVILDKLSDAIIVIIEGSEYCVPIMVMDGIQVEENPKVLEWCRNNAPESIRNFPNKELLETMNVAWHDYAVSHTSDF